jgi:hypothetical protein
MTLTGLHFLLSYQCLFACDHCFTWGSPQQHGTFSLANLEQVLDQAKDLGTIDQVYFEGGEPFLFYPLLLAGVHMAAQREFKAGIVTSGYWATSSLDAEAWLRPMADDLEDIFISSDLLHYDQVLSPEAQAALAAAERLGIRANLIVCETPNTARQSADEARGQSIKGGAIVFRGRAVQTFANAAPQDPWASFGECPHEELVEPERLHVDYLGDLHLCQGLLIGNLFAHPLTEIIAGYKPAQHPVIGPLLRGGPSQLVRHFGLPHAETYADACHLCYAAREQLRARFPDSLGPGQMYGEGLT